MDFSITFGAHPKAAVITTFGVARVDDFREMSQHGFSYIREVCRQMDEVPDFDFAEAASRVR